MEDVPDSPPANRSTDSVSSLVMSSDVIDESESLTHGKLRHYNRMSPLTKNRLSAEIIDESDDVELDREPVYEEQTRLKFDEKSMAFMAQRINELEHENYLLRRKADQYRIKMTALGVTEAFSDEAEELRQRRPRGLSTCLVPLY